MQFLELFFLNIDEMFTDIINFNFFFIMYYHVIGNNEKK